MKHDIEDHLSSEFRESVPLEIRKFESSQSQALIQLWQDCGLVRPWNDPLKDIERAVKSASGDILTGHDATGKLIASVMFGYDGHRGSLYYLAVAPEVQGKRYGKAMLDEVERLLSEVGCPKINLMVRSTNVEIAGFYEAQDYQTEPVVIFGKRLIPD